MNNVKKRIKIQPTEMQRYRIIKKDARGSKMMEKSEYGEQYTLDSGLEIEMYVKGSSIIWLTREDLVKMLAMVEDAEDEFLN